MNVYKVYILQSQKDFGYYIGCTSIDLSERLKRHNAGYEKSTRCRKPWELIYWEEYSDKSVAFKREFFLKQPKGYNDKLDIIEKCDRVAQPQKGPFKVS